MTATVRSLVFVLETFFPARLPLVHALSLLAVLISLYPLLKMHENQRSEPQQPRQTAWFKSLLKLGKTEARKVIEGREHIYSNHDIDQIVDLLCADLTVLYSFLGLDEHNPDSHSKSYFPKAPPILCTSRTTCTFCVEGNTDLGRRFTLRRKEEPRMIWLLDARLDWVQATLFTAHCPACRSEYYPDRITYRANATESEDRSQRLEFNTEVYRVSKHGVYVHRQVAVAQEKALLRFHAGWSNFADWLNEAWARQGTGHHKGCFLSMHPAVSWWPTIKTPISLVPLILARRSWLRASEMLLARTAVVSPHHSITDAWTALTLRDMSPTLLMMMQSSILTLAV